MVIANIVDSITSNNTFPHQIGERWSIALAGKCETSMTARDFMMVAGPMPIVASVPVVAAYYEFPWSATPVHCHAKTTGQGPARPVQLQSVAQRDERLRP